MNDRNIYLNGKKLEVVESYTYLGIRMDCNLSMENHVKHLFNSGVNMVHSLAKIRYCLDSTSAVQIFKAFILSKIEYGSLFCICVRKNLSDKLQKLIIKSLRICYKVDMRHSTYKLHMTATV